MKKRRKMSTFPLRKKLTQTSWSNLHRTKKPSKKNWKKLASLSKSHWRSLSENHLRSKKRSNWKKFKKLPRYLIKKKAFKSKRNSFPKQSKFLTFLRRKKSRSKAKEKLWMLKKKWNRPKKSILQHSVDGLKR